MANLKTYSELRSANLDENRRMLQELGVRMPGIGERVMLNKPKVPPKPKPRIPAKIPDPEPEEDDRESNVDGNRRAGLRTSFRVRLKTKTYQEEDEYISEVPKVRIPRARPDPSYGSIPGVEVGREWSTRMDCSYDLIHRPTVAGIHGGPDGAYSVALSGGYEDDIDFGESFTYTGEGGRDLKGTVNNPKNLRTAPQSKDQTLDRGNLALSISVETQNPVRVVRGYKLTSQYAPEFGYRYDGLYQVKKFWVAKGKSGFKVFKFAFVRCDPDPAPWVQVPSNKLGSPTSPSTPVSLPQTGVEACEAPSLEAEDSEDFSQLEEARKGAKQPEELKGPRKKVSFNSEDTVRFFETENGSSDDEKPPVLTRADGRTSRKTSVTESPSSEEDEPEPPKLRAPSKRSVKPTTKVLENISMEIDKNDKKATKVKDSLKLSEPPKAVVKSAKVELKEKCEEIEESSKNEILPVNTDETVETKEVSSRKRSLSPEYPIEESPKISPISSPADKSLKSPKSGEKITKRSPKGQSPVEKSKKPSKSSKRSASPGHLSNNSETSPKSLKSPGNSSKKSLKFTDNSSRKRSLSPEYPPEDIVNSNLPKSPKENKPKKQVKSLTSPDEKASKKTSKPKDESVKTDKEKKPKKSPSESVKNASKGPTKAPKKQDSPKKFPASLKKISLLSPPSEQTHDKSKKSTPPKSPTDKNAALKSNGVKKSNTGGFTEKSPKKGSKTSDSSLPQSSKTKPKTKKPKGSLSPARSSEEASPVTKTDKSAESPSKSTVKHLKAKTFAGGDSDVIERENLGSELSSTEDNDANEMPIKRKRSRPNNTPVEEPETKKIRKGEPESLTPPETETSISRSSSPLSELEQERMSSTSSPASVVTGFHSSVVTKSSSGIMDGEDFPSDDEIFSMMQFSLSACTENGCKTTVKMVNGKWVEVEEPSRKNEKPSTSIQSTSYKGSSNDQER